MLEECKKKHNAEDLQAAIASFEVDQRGTVKKIKEIDFASTSNNTFDTPPLEVKTNVSISSSPSPFVTVNDLITVIDNLCLLITKSVQDMVDKSNDK